MNLREDEVRSSLARIEALVPAAAEPKDYLGRLLDAELETLSAARVPMGLVASAMRTPQQAIASAMKSVEMLESPERVAARPEGIIDLGFIEWLLRPAIPLIDGAFSPPLSGPWANLQKDHVRQIARSICRIDVFVDERARIHIGTGVVVGTDSDSRLVLLTNAHVVDQARMNLGWPEMAGFDLVCDFHCEIDTARTAPLTLSREYRRHPKLDLAVLFINPTGNSNDVAPDIIMTGEAPEPLIGNAIAVVGHPSFNAAIDSLPRRFGFGDLVGVKRFSPGYIVSLSDRCWLSHVVPALLHDASTLSGSSGSGIFDLTSQNLLGLHFGGWPVKKPEGTTGDSVSSLFEANGAVPLWPLKDSDFFKGIKLP